DAGFIFGRIVNKRRSASSRTNVRCGVFSFIRLAFRNLKSICVKLIVKCCVEMQVLFLEEL
ncbi:MAG: hypothetical protein RR132_00175, partial [Rikenellaceae bacterium]